MAHYDFTRQRLFVSDKLDREVEIEMDRARSNYLINVLRLKTGAQLLLFNGRDGEWLGQIDATGRKRCTIRLLQQCRQQPPPYDLVYAFAPLKKARLDYMIQKAVEMGAGVLQPVITQHTQFSKLNPERLQAHIIEAAEQCGILSITRLNAPQSLGEMIENWDDDRMLIYGDETSEVGDPINALRTYKGRKLALLIGPEGGFSEDEHLMLKASKFTCPISLGPRILRADTAAVAALAVIQAACGDWT